MSAARRIAILSWYSWIGAWRRWIVFLPPALFALTLVAQLPRVGYVRGLFREEGRSASAVSAYAAFIGANYGNLLVFGALLAVALGAAGTGSRRLGGHILPILARGVSRAEFVIARMVGYGFVVLLYHLVAALAFEILGASLEAPVRVSPWAYVVPLVMHWLLLSIGLAFGSILPAVPATAAALAASWLVVFLGGNEDSTVAWLRATSRVMAFVLPPLGDLFLNAAPFASPTSVGLKLALLFQAAAWIGIVLTLTTARFDGLDFTARGA